MQLLTSRIPSVVRPLAGPVAVVVASLIGLVGPVAADDSPSSDTHQLCSLAAEAARTLGVSSDNGVSVDDCVGELAIPPRLDNMATYLVSKGLHAVVARGLTYPELMAAQGATIVPIRRLPEGIGPTQYVLVEDTVESNIEMRVAGGKTAWVPTRALDAVWNGSALVISAVPLTAAAISYRQARVHVVCGLLAILGLVTATWRLWRHGLALGPANGSWVGQTAGIGGAAALLGVLLNLAYSGPLIAAAASDAPPGDEVLNWLLAEEPDHSTTFRRLEREELIRLISKTPGVMFVDARSSKAFAKGHVEGAISLPSWAPADIRLAFAGIPRDTPLVVYCSSRSCGMGAAAGRALSEEGFSDVHLYVAGWEELQFWDGAKFNRDY